MYGSQEFGLEHKNNGSFLLHGVKGSQLGSLEDGAGVGVGGVTQ